MTTTEWLIPQYHHNTTIKSNVPSATLPPERLASKEASAHHRCSDATGDCWLPSAPASFIDTWWPLRAAVAAAC